MRRRGRKLVPKSPEPPRISPIDAAALLLASMAACGHADCAAKAAAGDLGLMGEDGEPRSLTPDELRLARAKASLMSPTGVPGQGEVVHVVTDLSEGTQIYDVTDLMAALANTTN